MHTKDHLAQELRKAGLEEMAKRAETGFYHDFLSPLDLPEMQLLQDLTDHMKLAQSNGEYDRAKHINELRKRHMDGEFDASIEESEAWANSPEGREAFGKLIRGE